MNLLTLFALEGETATTEASQGGLAGTLITFVPFILIIAVMYFLMIRPQKKKQKEEEKMRKSIQIGDEILTIGGIYGKVVSVKDDSIVIESVSDHSTKLKFAIWAVNQNLTVHDDTEGK